LFVALLSAYCLSTPAVNGPGRNIADTAAISSKQSGFIFFKILRAVSLYN
jgi:hypothetical protein